MDREKNINDSQDAVNDDWMWQHADYYAMTMENALSLLKEQEGTISELQNAYGYLQKQFFEVQDELLKEQEADKWIPVSERLPKNMANKVIVYLQHEDLVSYIGYGHYEKFHGEEMWYDLENGEQFSKRGYTVTHWMPMPKSPEGVKLMLS
jgi:hypothetical protein